MVLVAIVWVVSSCMAAQVEVIVPLEHVAAADVANWVPGVAKATADGAARLGSTLVVPRPAENSVRIAGETESVEWVRSLVAALDRRARQVAFDISLIQTHVPEELLGVPVTTTLEVGGEVLEVPTRLIAPGAYIPRVPVGRGRQGPAPDLPPPPQQEAVCNTEFDAEVLAALLAAKKARTLAEPRVVVSENASGYVGLGVGPGAWHEVDDLGIPARSPKCLSFSVRPTIAPDGRILVQGGFTAADSRGGWASLGATWMARPGVPVAVGPLPLAPNVQSVVYIVTCRSAEP